MTFKLLFESDRPYVFQRYVQVDIYPTRAMMTTAAIDKDTSFLDGGPKTGLISALMEEVHRGPIFAKISLTEEDLSHRTIVHECVHVAKYWAKRGRIIREEALAYGVEKLYSKIVRAIHRRGLKVDEDTRNHKK